MTDEPKMTDKPNMLKRTLAVIGAVADVSAVSAAIALLTRRDAVLILVMVMTGVGVVWALSRLFKRGFIDRQHLGLIGAYFLLSIIIAAVPLAWPASVKITPIQITITEPQDGSNINGPRHMVKGIVKDHPDAGVYVVVRPLVPQNYWVQDSPTIDSQGSWQVNAYFGDLNVGVNEDYEIIALATDENFLVTLMTGSFLTTGQTKSIPVNMNRSNIVTVRRTS
jgi:hypothetical protein